MIVVVVVAVMMIAFMLLMASKFIAISIYCNIVQKCTCKYHQDDGMCLNATCAVMPSPSLSPSPSLQPIGDINLSLEVAAEVKAGGVILHHANTLHCSHPNTSQRDR